MGIEIPPDSAVISEPRSVAEQLEDWLEALQDLENGDPQATRDAFLKWLKASRAHLVEALFNVFLDDQLMAVLAEEGFRNIDPEISAVTRERLN